MPPRAPAGSHRWPRRPAGRHPRRRRSDQSHLTYGDLHQGLVHDAVRVPLIEIGEAVTDMSSTLLSTEPAIP